MSNPYQTLGVPKDADAATIKKAYRKAAKRTHTDIGGDKGEFQAINSAYMVLSDPARRSRYDETGDASEPKDNTVSELLRLFVQVAAGCTVYQNPVNRTRETIQQQLAGLKQQEREAVKEANRIAGLAERVKVVDGQPNLLRTSLENHAESQKRQAAVIREAHERGEKMLALLEHYDFEAAEQSPMQCQWGSMKFTAFDTRENQP